MNPTVVYFVLLVYGLAFCLLFFLMNKKEEGKKIDITKVEYIPKGELELHDFPALAAIAREQALLRRDVDVLRQRSVVTYERLDDIEVSLICERKTWKNINTGWGGK